jgi:hypothetical protein
MFQRPSPASRCCSCQTLVPMSNSVAVAERWTRFIAERPEFLAGARLLAQFKAGSVKSLCDCGCNSYEFSPSIDTGVPLLATADGRFGSVFEMMFQTEDNSGSVEFAVFVDGQGRLAGMDVAYCANSYPMPEQPRLAEPPYHVRLSESVGA